MIHNTVDFVFNVINVMVRFGLILFVIRRYVVPRISQNMAYEHTTVQLLEQKQHEFKQESTVVREHIKEQEQLYQDIQKKFQIWQAAIAQAEQQNKIDCQLREKNILLQVEQKQEYAKRRYVNTQELPIILEQTRQSLQQEFSQNPELGQRYITSVLQALHGK